MELTGWIILGVIRGYFECRCVGVVMALISILLPYMTLEYKDNEQQWKKES